MHMSYAWKHHSHWRGLRSSSLQSGSYINLVLPLKCAIVPYFARIISPRLALKVVTSFNSSVMCACRVVLFSGRRGTCLCVAGPTRRRRGRPISSGVVEWLGAATTRTAGSITRDRRISTRAFVSVAKCLQVAEFRTQRCSRHITTWLLVIIPCCSSCSAYCISCWGVGGCWTFRLRSWELIKCEGLTFISFNIFQLSYWLLSWHYANQILTNYYFFTRQMHAFILNVLDYVVASIACCPKSTTGWANFIHVIAGFLHS